MYKGNNPSALRSQKWIAKALIELMEEKPYEEITVKEITERCDLARQTFYKVFSSKEEVLEMKLDILFSEFLKKMKEENVDSVRKLAQLYLLFYDSNKDFINLFFKNQLNNIIVKRLMIYLPEIHPIKEEEREANPFLESFLSSGLVNLLQTFYYYSKDCEEKNFAHINDLYYKTADYLAEILECKF